MIIGIIDCGGANLNSIYYSFKRLGINTVISSSKDELSDLDAYVLPGVGSANAVMQCLKDNSLIDFIKNIEFNKIYTDKIVTEVNEKTDFYKAEIYHHDYYTKNPKNAYCQAVINPKLNKLRSVFSDLISE